MTEQRHTTSNPRDDEVVTIAQNLARNCCWHVFPVRADKRPACPHGFKDAVNEPDAIIALWRAYPAPLIGVATGAISGIDILDLDLKHGAALHWWHANHSHLPVTRTYRTRSGGLHLVFMHHAGLNCSAGKIRSGIDVRADGGYAIAWFAAGFDCLDHALPASWPAPLLSALLPKPAPPPAERTSLPHHREHAIKGALRRVVTAAEGERNALLHWCACRLAEHVRDGLLGADKAEYLLVAAGMAAGLDEREAQRTARSGLRRAAA